MANKTSANRSQEVILGKINWGRVLLGSLIWFGVLHLLGAVVYPLFLRAEWIAAWEATGRPFDEPAAFGVFILVSVPAAIVAMWLYAAIRPRYGAGPTTAIRAGFALWLTGMLLPTLVAVRLLRLPPRFLIAEAGATLVSVVVATLAGAWPYQE